MPNPTANLISLPVRNNTSFKLLAGAHYLKPETDLDIDFGATVADRFSKFEHVWDGVVGYSPHFSPGGYECLSKHCQC